ncbi:MAG TPA: energy transducer TonB [Methylomirabilota bacterium]|nr:energy transducer TonB [Methylomirabilota bacterium]
MAPSAIAEHPVKEDVIVPKLIEIVPLELGPRHEVVEDHTAIKPAFKFSEAVLLEENHFKTGSRTMKALISITAHVALISIPILLGLLFTDTINIKQFAQTLLVAPPPPPPPPPPATAPLVKTVVKPRFMSSGKLYAPTIIPKQIADIKEAPLEPDSFGGVAGGVPGGVPGGQMGGVIGGVLGGIPSAAAHPVAPPSGKMAPIRVGGRVRPPKPIVQVKPEYPTLARQARIQGQVQIDAVLDEQGNVIEMHVVSGPPLLYQAALDALRKWKYEPTYLNDQPIAVQMIVTITFVLGQ